MEKKEAGLLFDLAICIVPHIQITAKISKAESKITRKRKLK